MDKPLLLALKGQSTKHIPFWFMRQAGRYLPEYREIRKSYKQFLEFCYTVDAAVEVTLQPIRRFDMDAAILFSDILVLPHAMGADVWFEEGEGPRINPITTQKQISELKTEKEKIEQFLSPVFTILKTLKEKLPKEKTLIGFAGAPWTIACYMVQGRGQGKEEKSAYLGFSLVREKAKADPEFFHTLIEYITEATIHYLNKQIESGAEVIQLFDSWAGVLTPEEFETWCINPTQKIVSEIDKQYPQIPVIGFPRGSGEKAQDYVKKAKVTGISVDESQGMDWVKNTLQGATIVQGGITNTALAGECAQAVDATKAILENWSGRPFIFNLAHGILPHTPVENVAAVAETIKAFRRKI